MTGKHLFVAFSFLLVLGIVVLLFYRINSTSDRDDTSTGGFKLVRLSPEEKTSHLQLHPLASIEKIANAKKQQVSTWKEWAEAHTEIVIARHVSIGNLDTPQEIAAFRQSILKQQQEKIERFKLAQIPPPKTPVNIPLETWNKLFWYESHYHGPQTPEALIAEFDETFLKSYPQSVDLDTRYPKEEWIQRLLDKGAHFKGSSDYSYYLRLRRDLHQKKNQPDEWRSGKYGIPITTDFEEYEDGVIERKIWENRMLRKVTAENTNTPMTTIFFPSNHPNKYLPVIGKMTYVRRGEGSSLRTWGTTLTQEQRDDLLYRGKHPEDIEIVYIDGSYNVLSEPPKPYNREEWIKENAYVTEIDSIPLTPKNYEEVLGQPMPERWKKWYEKEHAIGNRGIVSAPDTETIRTTARDAMKTDQTRFQQGLRELERFVNMSDAEFQAELERQFTPQFPELPTVERLENQLWSEAQSALMTPARFEAALKILEQSGPEEGMRKLTQADPKAAAQVKRLFGGAPVPEQPPKPPTRPKQREGTAPPEPNAP